jgi:hypothetical protein
MSLLLYTILEHLPLEKGEHPGFTIQRQFAAMTLEELHALPHRVVFNLSPYLKEEVVGIEKWNYIRSVVMLNAGAVLAGAMSPIKK